MHVVQKGVCASKICDCFIKPLVGSRGPCTGGDRLSIAGNRKRNLMRFPLSFDRLSFFFSFYLCSAFSDTGIAPGCHSYQRRHSSSYAQWLLCSRRAVEDQRPLSWGVCCWPLSGTTGWFFTDTGRETLWCWPLHRLHQLFEPAGWHARRNHQRHSSRYFTTINFGILHIFMHGHYLRQAGKLLVFIIILGRTTTAALKKTRHPTPWNRMVAKLGVQRHFKNGGSGWWDGWWGDRKCPNALVGWLVHNSCTLRAVSSRWSSAIVVLSETVLGYRTFSEVLNSKTHSQLKKGFLI